MTSNIEECLLGQDFCYQFPFLAPFVIFTIATLYLIWFATSTVMFNYVKYVSFWMERDKYDKKQKEDKKVPETDYNEMCLYLLLEYTWNCEQKRINSVSKEHFNVQNATGISSDSDWLYCYENAYIYPTISDSIADGNDIFRRIFNILTTACAYILMMFVYYDFMNSSPERQARDFWKYYMLSIIGLVTLVFVPLFPNNAIRMQKYLIMKEKDFKAERRDPVENGKVLWLNLSERLHLGGITLTVVTMTTAIWNSHRDAPTIVNVLFTIFGIFVVLFTLVNLFLKFGPKATSNTKALFSVFLHISETGLLLSLVFSFLFTAWSRNSAVWTCFKNDWWRFFVPCAVALVCVLIFDYVAFWRKS